MGSKCGGVSVVGVKIGAGLLAATLLTSGVNAHAAEVSHRRLSMEVVPSAAIVDSPTTVGISDSSLFFASDAEIDRTFQELQKLGVKNIRIQIPWAGVEVNPDVYIWRAIDKQVNAAEKYGMGILGVINQSPHWVAPTMAGHPEPAEFAEFAAEVAQRYKGEISAYEIWNEPNSIQFFDPIDPVAYAELLKAAYPAIKAVDPSITVIGGVLGAVIGQGAVVLNPVKFVEGMLNPEMGDAAGSFDALSFHPYQYTLKFSEGDAQVASPKRQIEAIRLLMALYGVGDLPIWATEYGEPTTDGDVGKQADFIEDFLRSWQDVYLAGPIFIYTTRDFATGSPSDQDNFGVFYSDWQRKPAADVIKDFIDSLAPDDHPIRDAIRAAIQALVLITGEIIRVGAEAFVKVAEAVIDVTKFVIDTTIDVVKLVVKTTAEVIAGAIELGVDIVKAGVDIITGAVDRIVTAVKDCFASHGIGVTDGAEESTARTTSVLATAFEIPSGDDVPKATADPDAVVTVENQEPSQSETAPPVLDSVPAPITPDLDPEPGTAAPGDETESTVDDSVDDGDLGGDLDEEPVGDDIEPIDEPVADGDAAEGEFGGQGDEEGGIGQGSSADESDKVDDNEADREAPTSSPSPAADSAGSQNVSAAA